MADAQDDPLKLNQPYRFKSVPPGTVGNTLQDRELRDEPGVTEVLSAASMDDVYAEKVISYKWSPDLKLLAIEGRNRVSFEHVKQARTEIGFTYFWQCSDW
jgi:hypothetical protein